MAIEWPIVLNHQLSGQGKRLMHVHAKAVPRRCYRRSVNTETGKRHVAGIEYRCSTGPLGTFP